MWFISTLLSDKPESDRISRVYSSYSAKASFCRNHTYEKSMASTQDSRYVGSDTHQDDYGDVNQGEQYIGGEMPPISVNVVDKQRLACHGVSFPLTSEAYIDLAHANDAIVRPWIQAPEWLKSVHLSSNLHCELGISRGCRYASHGQWDLWMHLAYHDPYHRITLQSLHRHKRLYPHHSILCKDIVNLVLLFL